MGEAAATPADALPVAALQACGRRLRPAVIAIDGPAASGKSTVGFAVAARLDYLYFDTGIMYRAVTFAALAHGIAIGDEARVTQLAGSVAIDLLPPPLEQQDGRQVTVLLDHADVTWSIRTPEVDQQVSPVAAYPGVRAALTQQQRRIGDRYGRGTAEKPGIVMVGRDIGTVVMPAAAVKVYMDASPEERARRRHGELLARGKAVAYEQVLADIRRRDEIDSQRAVAPLRPAADALWIDTTALTPEAVVARVLQAVAERAACDGV